MFIFQGGSSGSSLEFRASGLGFGLLRLRELARGLQRLACKAYRQTLGLRVESVVDINHKKELLRSLWVYPKP